VWTKSPSFKLTLIESSGLLLMYRESPNRTNTESPSLPTERCTNPFDAVQSRSILGSTIPRGNAPQGSSSRIQGADSVLWMRDVTALTGVHRSTITRWISRGEFPKKDAPYGNPNGWLRSTYDRWLLGAVLKTSRVDSVGT
jgi:predicted DNA-binding transcriptional regulator AlpA